VNANMNETTRQQRRKLVRERLKTGERTLARGLSARPGRDDVIAVAQVLRSKLAETDNPRRASEAVVLAQRLAESSLRSFPSKSPIACARGCSYCCYGFVAVIGPEAFRLADAVRAGLSAPIDVATARAAAALTRGISPDDRVGRKLPCPLLHDGACSVYAVRPLVCRQATSLSLPGCIEEFEGVNRTGQIPISGVHLAHASNANVALIGAMLAAGLPTDAYELGAALEVALADPDCERRWLAGENVFETAGRPITRQRESDQVAAAIASELAG
jgi:Fe-S-cluster containining protein